MSKDGQMTEIRKTGRIFYHSLFGFVSSFDIRHSDLVVRLQRDSEIYLILMLTRLISQLLSTLFGHGFAVRNASFHL